MDRRIRVLCLPAAGLNEAIARARGEFIARTDADDISRSDRLARQVALLKEQPDVGVVSCLVNLQVRPLSAETGLLPRSHGSALFQRGETQVLCLATLAPTDEAQNLDGYTGGETIKRFILHYNFPPFSVGETGRTGGLNRREIGHGNLAERSILPVIPSESDFPYAVRVGSEVTESDGSTSMASVCAGVLALMDAGVPIRRPVAGVSCGLVTEYAGDEISR